MLTKERILSCLLVVAFIVFFSAIVFAYSLPGHQKITEKGLEFISVQEIQQFREDILDGARPKGSLANEDLDWVPGNPSTSCERSI